MQIDASGKLCVFLDKYLHMLRLLELKRTLTRAAFEMKDDFVADSRYDGMICCTSDSFNECQLFHKYQSMKKKQVMPEMVESEGTQVHLGLYISTV